MFVIIDTIGVNLDDSKNAKSMLFAIKLLPKSHSKAANKPAHKSYWRSLLSSKFDWY